MLAPAPLPMLVLEATTRPPLAMVMLLLTLLRYNPEVLDQTEPVPVTVTAFWLPMASYDHPAAAPV